MTNLNLKLDSNISDFLKYSTPYLLKDSSLHSLILSLAARYEQIQKPMSLLIRAEDENGNFIMSGIQTEIERPLIISKGSVNDSKTFAKALSAKIPTLPGVNGPLPSSDAFAETWSEEKKCKSTLGTNLRLFELTMVESPKPTSGFIRPAISDDEKIIFQWAKEFHQEATPHDPASTDEELYKGIREGINKEQYFMWEDQGECVCWVGSRRETAEERWIAPVYTPKHLRGKGYASALVAAVSEKIVKSGKRGMLFTDLANPTSNSIYQKIGYQPLADFKHFFFT